MLHLPRRFYFTDESTLPLPSSTEEEARLLTKLHQLPEDTGIILRHYSLSQHQRARLGNILKKTGRVLLVAGDPQLARRLAADGLHLPQWQLQSLASAHARLTQLPSQWIISAAIHGLGAGAAANRMKVDLAFASPVRPTQSHPNAAHLGTIKLAHLVSQAQHPVYALGGMNEKSFKQCRHTGIAGYGGIRFSAA